MEAQFVFLLFYFLFYFSGEASAESSSEEESSSSGEETSSEEEESSSSEEDEEEEENKKEATKVRVVNVSCLYICTTRACCSMSCTARLIESSTRSEETNVGTNRVCVHERELEGSDGGAEGLVRVEAGGG